MNVISGEVGTNILKSDYNRKLPAGEQRSISEKNTSTLNHSQTQFSNPWTQLSKPTCKEFQVVTPSPIILPPSSLTRIKNNRNHDPGPICRRRRPRSFEVEAQSVVLVGRALFRYVVFGHVLPSDDMGMFC